MFQAPRIWEPNRRNALTNGWWLLACTFDALPGIHNGAAAARPDHWQVTRLLFQTRDPRGQRRCHGPYFLHNVVELKTEGGIVGIAETPTAAKG